MDGKPSPTIWAKAWSWFFKIEASAAFLGIVLPSGASGGGAVIGASAQWPTWAVVLLTVVGTAGYLLFGLWAAKNLSSTPAVVMGSGKIAPRIWDQWRSYFQSMVGRKCPICGHESNWTFGEHFVQLPLINQALQTEDKTEAARFFPAFCDHCCGTVLINQSMVMHRAAMDQTRDTKSS